MAENFPSLPEDCWELIFRFLLLHRRRHSHHFETLSLVCKEFLTITNNLRSTLTISDLTIPALPRIYSRFRQLKRIDLGHFKAELELDRMLFDIADSGLDLESLDISNQSSIPAAGLTALGSTMRNLRVLRCSKIGFMQDYDLVVIATAFPNLEELDISYPANEHLPFKCCMEITDSGILDLIHRLPRLRKVNLSGNSLVTDTSFFALATECMQLKEIVIRDCDLITESGIAKALRCSSSLSSISASLVGFAPDLIDSLVSMKNLTCLDLSESAISDELLFSIARSCLPLKKLVLLHCRNFSIPGILFLLHQSCMIEWLDLAATYYLTDEHVNELSECLPLLKFINLSSCRMLTCFSLFILARNCPALTVMVMEFVNLTKKGDLVTHFVNPQLISLHLSGNPNLCDKSVREIASILPNLEILKLNHCRSITNVGIVEILSSCTKIRRLELNYCSGIKNFVLDFELSAMEALRLQGLGIEASALAMIGRRCPSLIHLDLGCSKVTAEGVKEVVRNCRGLRGINLVDCPEIDRSIVYWMVFSRPSLRAIVLDDSVVPTTATQRNLFLRHGCMIINDESCWDLKDILEYPCEGHDTIILADVEYGSKSSRNRAAKEVMLLVFYIWVLKRS